MIPRHRRRRAALLGAAGEGRTLSTMALYEFRCRTCGDVFEIRRPMQEAGSSASCPQGHTDTVKLLSTFARTGAAVGAPGPVGGGCCGGACGCGH
jgi:putative FmdB family regulatory protein